MLLKKLHFPIYILSITLFIVVLSCKKEQENNAQSKGDIDYSKNFTLAEKYIANQEFDSAFHYYNKIKSSANPTKDQDRIIYSLIKIAFIQQAQADYSGSESSATEAIPYFQAKTNSAYKCSIYNILGINYTKLFDYKNALYYYNQAYNLAENKLEREILKNNIAFVYKEKEDYQQAIKIFLPLSTKKEVQDNPENYARILDNLGRSYFKIGNPKSLDFLEQSLVIRKKIKSDIGMTTSYISLSEFYNKTNPKLANQYAQLAYEKATKLNSVDERLKSLELLIQNNAGNHSKTYSKNYFYINDSINKVRQKAKNQFAKIKYDSKKEKDENQKLKAQKIQNKLQLEKQKNGNLLLFILIIISIGVTVFIAYFLIARSKREKIKVSYDTETRIAKKLHDELANDVYHTMAFAETQDLSSDQNKEILLNNLETIYSRTRNISRENSAIANGNQFVPSLKEMMSGFNTNSVNILVNGIDTVSWDTIESNKKITVYRVLQELLVNLKKHSKCSLAVISFTKNNGKLQIDYSDNGIGVAFDKINLKNGLQNVENRILGIKGTITFDTKPNKGFKASFIFSI